MEIKQVQVAQQELQEIFDLERDVAPKLKRIEELQQGVKALLIARMKDYSRVVGTLSPK